VGDAAVAARGQKEHLVFPGVRGERPAVTEDHRLPTAPVLVVDLRAVLRGDRAHRCSPEERAGSGFHSQDDFQFGGDVPAAHLPAFTKGSGFRFPAADLASLIPIFTPAMVSL